MFILFAISQSFARPVSGDLQLVLGEEGMDKGRQYIMTLPIEFREDDVYGEYECWDRIGVRELNFDAELEELEFSLGDSVLSLRAVFDSFRGEDMIIYAEDDELWDTCVSFEGDVYYVDIEDLVFEISLQPSINQDGLLQMEVVGEPTITGDLQTDISWFPDALALYFFEEQVFDLMRTSLMEQIPLLVDTYANSLSYSNSLSDFEFAVALEDAEIQDDGLYVGAEVEIGYVGGEACSSGSQSYFGRNPVFDFSSISSADIGVGITEQVLNNVVAQLWLDGLFCFREHDFAVLYELIADLFGVSVDNLSAQASLDSIPIFLFEEDGISVLMGGVNLTVWDTDDQSLLLDAALDVTGRAELVVDPAISAFGISVHELDLSFQDLTVNGLLSDEPNAEEYLILFIERWVVGQIEERTSNITLYQSVFSEFGLYAFVKDVTYVTGGIISYIDFFSENDPQVDRMAPDTSAAISDQQVDAVTVIWSGTDDREGELAFSFRLDSDSWSAWTTYTETTFDSLLPGIHTVEVKARDRWWNEDPVPAQVLFSIDSQQADGDSEADGKAGGCSGCSAAQGSMALGWLGLMLVAVGFRRQ